MERMVIQAGALPALVWGRKAASVIIAVHGNQSNREDRPIEALAEIACVRGWQVLSYDLPEHGTRKGDPALCRFAECVSELAGIVRFARERWTRVALFGVSMGASFALLGCGELLDCAWFLSPVTDMLGLTRGMMAAFGVSEAELEERRAVPTPIGQTIYWEDYRFLRANPVQDWPVRTDILCGEQDDVSGAVFIRAFAERFGCVLEVVPGAGHYFHTEGQMCRLREWLSRTLPGA